MRVLVTIKDGKEFNTANMIAGLDGVSNVAYLNSCALSFEFRSIVLARLKMLLDAMRNGAVQVGRDAEVVQLAISFIERVEVQNGKA